MAYLLSSRPKVRAQSLADALEDIKQALAAEFQASLEIKLDRTEFGVGETVAPSLTIRNLGKADIKAPETFWSATVILDGKVYQRVAQDPWSGAGMIAPGSAYEGSVRLSEHEFGIKPAVLGLGEHKLAMNIGDERSNEVTFTIRAEKPKVSLKIESDRLKYLPGEDVVVMVTIGNLGPDDIEAPATYWSARIILDGKEYSRLEKFIGDWNGPAFIIPNGVYRGGITLAEYGVDPSTLKPGDHKLSLKIGNDVSNELTFSIQADKRDTADQERAAALLTKQLADIAALKPGGSREDFLRLFQEEGGISNRTQRRYAYRANPNIKVDVTFEAVGMPEEKLAESPKDKVLTISKPLVELPISDTLTHAVPNDKRKLQAGPSLSLKKAVELAEAYAERNRIDLSKHHVASVRLVHKPDAIGKFVWEVIWDTSEDASDDEIELIVEMNENVTRRFRG